MDKAKKNNKNMVDISGKTFGEWLVIDTCGKINHRRYWNCICSCGNKKMVDGAELKRGRSTSCGHNKRVDLTGKIFSEWIVLYSSRISKDGKFVRYWMCQCSCGEKKEVIHGNLTSGISTNCGHINKVYDDIKQDSIFGKWKVIGNKIRKNKSNYYLCKCICCNEKYVEYKSLLTGTSTNCGCKHNDGIKQGDKFGRLTVINFDHRNENGSSFYLCKCICGKDKIVKGAGLKSGGTTSCGCYRSELSSILYSNIGINSRSKKYNWYLLDDKKNKTSCKSSFEVLFWNYYYHVLNNKTILYEPKTFVLEKNMRYTPDFFIENENLWIETKGSFNLNKSSMRQKSKILKLSEIENIKILFWKDIVKFCNLRYKTSGSYFNNAKKLNMKIEDYLGNMIYLKGVENAHFDKTVS